MVQYICLNGITIHILSLNGSFDWRFLCLSVPINWTEIGLEIVSPFVEVIKMKSVQFDGLSRGQDSWDG